MKLEGRFINPYKAWVGSFVPNWLLSRTEVSQGAKLAYARLAQYAGDHGVAWPKRETIAAELGISESQFDRYIKELESKHALVEVEQLGFGKANRYRFLMHQWISEVMTIQDSAYMQTHESPHTQSQESADMRTPLKRISRRESKEEETLTLPDFIPKDSWEEFLAHRKRKRAPTTKEVAERLFERLRILRGIGYDPKKVIEDAIDRNWTTIKVEWVHKPQNGNGDEFNPDGTVKAPERTGVWARRLGED